MTTEQQYSDAMLAGMQAAYGDGFLSPGAAPDVRRLLASVEIKDRHVLDFGCGVGGAAVMFAGEFGARQVTAADPEAMALHQTAERAAVAGLGDRVTTVAIEPGPLPFPDDRFDVIYSKDVICHIADKEALFGELHRVLAPGGTVALGDWTAGSEAADNATLDTWVQLLAAGGLSFHFESAADYARALQTAGFATVDVDDVTPVFLAGAAEELANLLSAEQDGLRTTLGSDGAARRIALTRARHEALVAAGVAYHHLRAGS
jgi:phosphoethanolamine N-methyltransferase